MADSKILQVMSPTGQLPVEDIVMNDAGTSSQAGANPGPNVAEGNLGTNTSLVTEAGETLALILV